ncbi:uncharacterized protein LOC106761168 [Vigna radiata var. radiata]|uniref:Uncharacterized protein LOC106761168 n=1 Tax=Vigna radiata var. radiata TaxID=3916 RepID=A0A1S3U2B7_VIGRR|nr:uncharacterized protein LOC106761168 [Vigna radiata var. radiata]
MPFSSASVTELSEELRFSLMNTESANCARSPNDTTTLLPVGSQSPFPHWNLNETSHFISNETAGGTSMNDSSQFRSYQNFQRDHNYSHSTEEHDSSQFRSYQNFQMDHNYSHRAEEHNFLPCRPNSCYPCPEGYIGWPYQYDRQNNLTIPANVRNAAFNLNNFEKPDGGGMYVTPGYGLNTRPQMFNPRGRTMSGNIDQPSLDMNLGMSLCNPNQGGAEPLLAIGKRDEKFRTISSGSNINEFTSGAEMPKFNSTCHLESAFLPSISTYHNQQGSRGSLNSGLDTNVAFSGFQNEREIISDLAPASNHEALFDSRPGLCLGPSYAFQRPASDDQNHYLGQVSRNLGLGGVKDISMEFTDIGRNVGPERCMDLNSLPVVASKTVPFESGQNNVNGQLLPSSSKMITDKLPAELLHKNNDKFASQVFSTPSLAMAPRSIRGQDLTSDHGQSQAGGSIHQSNSRLQPQSTSDLGIHTGSGNMTAQVSRSPIMSSLKRAASQPLSSTVQNQRRKTMPTQFINPSIPTRTRLAPSVPITSRAISPLAHPAQSIMPQATQSVVPPLLPTTWTKSALPVPNTTRVIPHKMHAAPLPPPNHKRVSSFHHPSSYKSPRTSLSNQHQLLAQALAHKRLKASIIPAVPRTASNHIKFKDQTPEPIGYKCFLCKRDLSYEPEGPISLPPTSPSVAVLSCGHTFHEYCLERITPCDQSKDPPCIPCALGE